MCELQFVQPTKTTGFTHVIPQFCWFISCVRHSYLGKCFGTFWNHVKKLKKTIQCMVELKRTSKTEE